MTAIPLPVANSPSRIDPAASDAATVPASGTSLDHLTLLRVAGADAVGFLDSQLTRNVPAAAAPGAALASLAGYCSPKGRLLATFVVWHDDDGVALVLSRDIATAVAKRLRMYVLRAKVTIVDASQTHGVEGFDAGTVPAAAALAPWQILRVANRTLVRWPDADGRGRVLVVRPLGVAGPLGAGAEDTETSPAGPPIDAATWRWADVRAGLPRVTAATQDRFVPQMLNLEALGAVDFKKGCFPGQEIVARSQYLGKLKRRTAVASTVAAPPVEGTDLWQAAGSEPCGVVVNAERGPDGRTAMLVEIPVGLFAADDLRLGATDGEPVVVEPLPYALPDNEVFVRPRL